MMSNNKCPKCGFAIKKGQNFCTECGFKLERTPNIKPNMTKYEKEMGMLSIPNEVKIEHNLNGKVEYVEGSFEVYKNKQEIKIYYPPNESITIKLTDIVSFKSSLLNKNFTIKFSENYFYKKNYSCKKITLKNVKYGKTFKEYMTRKLEIINKKRKIDEERAERRRKADEERAEKKRKREAEKAEKQRKMDEMQERKDKREDLIKNTGTLKCLTVSNLSHFTLPRDLKREYLFKFHLNEFEPPIDVFEKYLLDFMPAWIDGYFVSEKTYFALKYRKYLFEANPSSSCMETKVLPLNQIFDVIELKSRSFIENRRIIAILGTHETIYFAIRDDDLADLTVKTLKEVIQENIKMSENLNSTVEDETVDSDLSDNPLKSDSTANEIAEWFELFEKGAITEEEYEIKKKELLEK